MPAGATLGATSAASDTHRPRLVFGAPAATDETALPADYPTESDQVTVGPTSAGSDSLLDQLPIVGSFMRPLDPITSAAAPVLGPVLQAVSPLLTPLTAPLDSVVAPVAAAVDSVVQDTKATSALDTISALAAPIAGAATRPLGSVAREISAPLTRVTAALSTSTLQPIGISLQRMAGAPQTASWIGGSGTSAGTPRAAAPTGSLVWGSGSGASTAVPSIDFARFFAQPASGANSATYLADRGAAALQSEVEPTSVDGVGNDIPVPTPHAPHPTTPPSAAIGTAGTGNSGPSDSGSTGFIAESWPTQQLQLIGDADSARSLSPRDSANEPPVSPD